MQSKAMAKVLPKFQPKEVFNFPMNSSKSISIHLSIFTLTVTLSSTFCFSLYLCTYPRFRPYLDFVLVLVLVFFPCCDELIFFLYMLKW
jgi:hypothetical protein